MKYTPRLLFGLAAVLGVLCTTGCGSQPKSPARIAYTATDSAITTADSAISAWADYVVAERARIATLKATDPGAALDAANKLLVNEGRVSSAYYKYQDAARAAVLAGSASADAPGNAAASIAAAAAPLISLVASLTAPR